MTCIKIILSFTLLFSPFIFRGQTLQGLASLSSLSSLKDTARVDFLNALSQQYIEQEKKDSAMYFACMAFDESVALDYAYGKAVSLARKARIAKHFDDDFATVEKFALESLEWFKKTGRKDEIANAYNEMTSALHAQSRFEEAENYFRLLITYYKNTDNKRGLFNILLFAASINKDAGNYEKGFFYAQQSRVIATQEKNLFWIQCHMFLMGELFMKIEDYKAALASFRGAFQLDTPEFEKWRKESDWDIWVKMEYAEILSHLGQYDLAAHFFELYKPVNNNDRYYRIYLVSTGEFYFLKKDTKKALQNFLTGLYLHKKLNDRNEVQRTLIFISQTYLARGQYDSAIKFGHEALSVAGNTGAKQIKRDAYQVIYTVYDKLNQNDSANAYFRLYSVYKDSVADDKFKTQLAVSTYEQKLHLMEEEKRLQEQKLKQTTQQKRLLVTGIGALLLLGLIVFRSIMWKRKIEKQQLEHKLEIQKLESDKAKADLQQQSTELEIRALRAQMNPHFIFNSLNAINRFILQNNKAQASAYLTKFSRLVRSILQNSQASLITLESELESLKLYLDLEELRFEHHFTYSIFLHPSVEADCLKLPPLIIQPYVENAIWHGLMHKEEKGHLEIEISPQNQSLEIKIRDDGIGRKKAKELAGASNVRHKSMGLKITSERIEMIQKDTAHAPVVIYDLVHADGTAAGTEVIIKTPLIYA
jgi:tetratricopeptide (TPR) repeat protein